MRIRLWGTRGSLPVSGKEYARYGGSTTCVEVTTDAGEVIILDAGTGMRDLDKALAARPDAAPVICLTHLHMDHLQGLPYFLRLYATDRPLTLYGAKPREGAGFVDGLAALFNGVHFPVRWSALPRHDLREFIPGASFHVGEALVETAPANHPGGGVAYRITADGWTFAFTGDHEIPFPDPESDTASAAMGPENTISGTPDTSLLDWLAGADVVLADSQYTEEDHAVRRGWGHSHFEQWPDALARRGVKHLVFTHYSPDYDDAMLDRHISGLREAFAALPLGIHGGRTGCVIDRNGVRQDSAVQPECEVCDFFQRVAGFSDTHAVLSAILLKARELGQADAGTIYLEEHGELVFAAAQNDTLFPHSAANKFAYLNTRLPLDTRSIAGYVACTRAPLNIPDVYCLSPDKPYGFNSSLDRSTGYRTQSMLALPLINGKGKLLGVLQIINRMEHGEVRPFTPGMERIIARLGGMATIPLERSFMTNDMLMRMLQTSALRDPRETTGHVLRVGSMAAELYHRWAEAHQIDPEELLAVKGQLRLAAMLHDVGKIGIPDAVLKKPGRLTDEERRIMQTHAAQGASLFAGSPHDIDRMAWDIALHHHAKWDGTGYTGSPDIPSPSGRSIPLWARITTIADVYDALVSRRCYKDSWDSSDALNLLQKDAGTHFDPELVNHFSDIQDVIRAIFERYMDEENA